MKSVKKYWRLAYINFILARYGFIEVTASSFYKPFLILNYINPWNWFRSKSLTRGQRIRLALQDLGPIFVKFGQILSTRRDLLPLDIADELALLQDKVQPFPSDQAKAIVEQAYGCSLEDRFSEFDLEPLASASVAQVHAATLYNGKKVVVKIIRPNIEKLIQHDLALLYTFAKVFRCFSQEIRRLRPVEVIQQFEQQLMAELDLQREAANATQLRRNFENSDLLYVPEIYWDYIHKKVMVMERIYGVRISDIETLKRHGVNMKLLAERGSQIFFTQVFHDNFFHADMHPGNIFVDIKNPDNPKYLGVDFGIMGTLTTDDQRYLAENFAAFFRKDYRSIAELHVQSGWVPADTPVGEFEAVIRSVCEPILEKPLKDISFGKLLLGLFQTAKQFNMEVQPQLVLLQKTLLNVEGLGRDLYPELNLWETAKPFFENWVKERTGISALIKKIKQDLPFWIEKAPEMPRLIYDFLQHAQQPPAPQLSKPETDHTHIKRASFLKGIGVASLGGAGINLALGQPFWSLAVLVPGVNIALVAIGALSVWLASYYSAK